jgi:hypothetical protein
MRALAFLAILVLAPFSDAIAQEVSLEPGQRVRITAPDLGINQQAATFDALDGGVLTVTADSTMRCPLSDVTRLDVHRGQRGHTLLGGGVGFLVGGLVGVAVEAAACWATGEHSTCIDNGYVLFGGIGAALGTGWGLAVGSVVRTDKWEEVPLDRLRVSVVPQRGGRFGFGVSIAF